MAYGKAFESTFKGSMVGAGRTVFAVWFYCIANAKPPGLVELNPVLLAAIFGDCDASEVQKAIDFLCSPDEESRTPVEDGRRLVQEGNFLFRMPTWPIYNALRKEEERREQNRKAQANWREKRRGKRVSDDVSIGEQNKPTKMKTEKKNEDPEAGWLAGDTAHGQKGEGGSTPVPPDPQPTPEAEARDPAKVKAINDMLAKARAGIRGAGL